MIFHRTVPVCSAENTSVEKDARTESHSNVGSHGSSLRRNEAGMGPGTADDDKSVRLFKSVIGSFPRDDYVMHMALTQTGPADADKARLLLKFRNGFSAAITHAGAEPAHQLVNHFRQRTPIRHPAFNPFRHQLIQAIAAAVSFAHGHGVSGGIFHALGVTFT